MEIINLKEYMQDGKRIFSTGDLGTPVNTDLRRLIAAEGKQLVKGDTRTTCIDAALDDVENWSEEDAIVQEME